MEDVIKAVPIHTVKSLVKFKLENDSGGVATMTSVKVVPTGALPLLDRWLYG